MKEPFDLLGVQIEGDQLIEADRLHQGSNHARSDRLTTLMTFIRPRIAKIGNHRNYLICGATTTGVEKL